MAAVVSIAAACLAILALAGTILGFFAIALHFTSPVNARRDQHECDREAAAKGAGRFIHSGGTSRD